MISKKWKNLLKIYIEKKSNNHKNHLIKKNLYIFPNLKGFQLGTFIFFSFAASIFYQNNVGLLISIIFFIVYFISIIISYQNLNNIIIEPIENLIPKNNKVFLNFIIKNLSNKEKLNINIKFLNKFLTNINVANNRKILFGAFFTERGIQEIPSIELNSLFPFGIIKTFGVVKFKEKIYVYPEPIRPSKVLIDKLITNNLINENDYEFDSLIEANQNENLSRISWKYFSIKKKLLSKKFVNTENNNSFLIDIDLLNENGLETALSNAVYLIDYYYKKKINFALKYKNFTSDYSNSLTHKNDLLKFTANV